MLLNAARAFDASARSKTRCTAARSAFWKCVLLAGAADPLKSSHVAAWPMPGKAMAVEIGLPPYA
jgi:hypothetical protein